MVDVPKKPWWTYRLVHHDKAEPPWIGLHEVFCIDGKLVSWKIDAAVFIYDPAEDAQTLATQSLALAAAFAQLPILVESEMDADVEREVQAGRGLGLTGREVG
jgi:hypothetical protein